MKSLSTDCYVSEFIVLAIGGEEVWTIDANDNTSIASAIRHIRPYAKIVPCGTMVLVLSETSWTIALWCSSAPMCTLSMKTDVWWRGRGSIARVDGWWASATAIIIASKRRPPPPRPFNLEEDCKLNRVIWSCIGGDMRSVSPWLHRWFLAWKIWLWECCGKKKVGEAILGVPWESQSCLERTTTNDSRGKRQP